MFREYRGNTNAFPGETNPGREAGGSPNKKSKKPIVRTLEPRMVFDAAAAVAVEHAAPAAAHHEPTGDAGPHPTVAAPAWSHLAEALKAAPVTPIDKSAVMEGLAPIKPVAAHAAIGDPKGAGDAKGMDALPKISELNEKIDSVVGQAWEKAADKVATAVEEVTEHLQQAKTSEVRDEVDKAINGALEKASASIQLEVANLAERPLTVPPVAHHTAEGSKAPSISAAETKTDHPAAIDLPEARALDQQVGTVMAAVAAEKLEARITAHVAAELAPKVAPPPEHDDPARDHPAEKVNQSSTVEVTRDKPSDAAKPGTTEDPATEHHLPPASDRVVTDPRASDAKGVDVTAAAGATEPAPTEVFFIWDNVKDWQQIVARLGPNARVYVLDSTKDGVEQIAAILKGQSNISAIHIISHGSEGSLTLGTAVLDANSMQGEYRDELEVIGQAMTPDGDILIYGCDFAAGADGLQAAVILGDITHADVAASTDATGAAALGGDWVLERQTGKIETKVFTDQDYEYLLANPVIDLNGAQIGNNFTATYTEQAAAVSIVAADPSDGATVTDADNDLQSVTIVANAAPNGNSEHLNFAGTAIGLGSDSTTTVVVGGTTYRIVYTASTRTFVITNNAGGTIPSGGSTNTLVRSITYDDSSDNPTNGGANANRVFTLSATDVTGGVSPSRTSTINLTAVNDPPVDGSETNTVSEDTTLTVPVSTGLLSNASDVDGDQLTVTGYTIAGVLGTQAVGSAVTIPGVGAITINADGSYSFAPAANYAGTVPVITYTVSDGVGGTDTSTLTLTIVSTNDAPAGTDNIATINEDAAYTFSAASFGFTDPNDTPANAFQAVIITTLPPASEGTLLLSGVAVTAGQTIAVADIPNLTFQPAADVNGSSIGSFTFQVIDNGGTANGGQNTDQSPNTFAFNITAVNDPPVATDDTTTTPEDTTLNGNVLANDTDVDNDTLTVTQFSALNVTATAGQTGTIPGVGQITINADGTYTFIPVANYNGPVPTITYVISDGHGGTDTATLNITVVSVNDPPVDGNETNTVVEDTTLTVADGAAGDLLNNASDSDGGTLTITDYTIPGVNGGNPITAGTATVIDGVGTITINANGSYSFVPVANYDGPIPVITYTVSDGQGGTDTSTLSLAMTPVNDAPVGFDDAATTPENTPVSGNVLGNDTDVDNTTLTVTFFSINGTTYGAGTTANIAGVGSLVIHSDGSYTFTPASNYDGPVPTATYTVSDGALTDTAILTITITPQNEPPAAGDDTGTTPEDTTLSVPASSGLLTNDTDVDGDTLAITQFEVGGTTYSAGQTATIAGVGDLTVNSDGSYTFAPAPNYNGPVPVATYTVSDGNGGTDQGTLTLDVTPVNDPPLAVDDNGTTLEDTPLSGDVLTNDTDPDTGDTLTVVGFTVNGNTFIAGATTSLPEGTITINADGTYTLVPAANYTGPVPVITYTVSDGHGGTDTATLTLNVVPVNDPPVANDDHASTQQDTTLNGNVINNDSDVDGDTIVVTEYTNTGINGGNPIPAGTATPIPGVGTITINPDGSYIFVPAPGYVGPVPEVDYTISDGNGGTDQGALDINVIPIGGAAANDDVATTPEDTTLTGDVLDNDVGPNSNPISVADFTVNGTTYQPGDTAHLAQGDLIIGANGSYTFVPAPNYFGPVPVATYTATNGTASDTATLTITVTPVDDPPVAVDDTGTTPEDTTLTGNVLTNDTDIDSTTLTVTEFSVSGITATAGQTGTIPGVGQITINPNGSYTFVPAANYDGPVPVITYTVSDGTLTDTATLTINITPVNDAPVAVNDTGTTLEDTTLTVPATTGLLSNDSDVDNAVLTVTGFEVGIRSFTAGQTATIAGVGTLTINADGSYTFVPAANYNGPVPVATYTVSDGTLTDTATLTITITPVNDAPVANDDTATLPEDTTLTIPAASGLLANDSDVDNATTLTVEGFEVNGILFGAGTTANIPGFGALTIEADGSYTFTPVPNFNGTVPPVTYKVSDGSGGTATAVLTIIVTPVNDPPVDGDETHAVIEDTTLSVAAGSGLLNNATDVDGTDTLTITDYSIPGINGGNPIAAGTATLIPDVGTITINTDGSYTFAPAKDYTGPIPVITYTVSDNAGGTDTSTLTLTITPVNDPPVAENDFVTTPEDTTLTGSVLTNDTDVDGDTLTVDLYEVDGRGFLPGAPAVIPNVGTLTINADGSYTFVPVANYNGPVPVATYRIHDPSGLQSSANLVIVVTPVNDPPIDGDETNSVTEDTTLTVSAADGLLANTTDIDGGPPSVIGYTVAGQTGAIGADHLIDGVGTITINADGSYSFAPAANYVGAIPVITYTVSDGRGGTDTSTLTLTMIPVNDPPVASDDVATTPEDTAISGNVLGNDTDIDGDALSVTQFAVDGTTYNAGDTATIAGVGTLTIGADGNATFVPATDYNGAVPVATYTISDGHGGTDTATLTITVTPVNDPPVAGNDTGTTPEDTPLTGNVLTNDTDIDGGALSLTEFTVGGTTYTAGQTATVAGVGTLTVNADGGYTFVPAADYNGPVPVATYTVSDGRGGTDTATLTITVTPVNDPPVASDDTGTTPEDTTLNGNVLTNDTDIDGGALSVTQFVVGGTTYTAGQTATVAGVGTLTIGADGSYTFVPVADYNGPGPVATYTVSDGAGGTDTAVLTITVTPVNDAPVANDDTGTTREDTTLTGNVLSNDTDIDHDTLSVTQFVVSGTTYTAGQTAIISNVGALTVRADGSYTFVPAPNYNGPVPIATYTASDGHGGTDTATLTITITPVNDPPGPDPNWGGLPPQSSVDGLPIVPVDVASYFFDVDGDPLTYSAHGLPPGLSINPVTGLITGMLPNDASQHSPYLVVVTATDPSGAMGSEIFVWTVRNPAPIARDDAASVPEDTALTGNVMSNDTDIDRDPLTVTQFEFGGKTYAAGQTATISGVGTLVINADGSYAFAPALNFNGLVPPATYTLSDGNGGFDTAALTITVTPVNDPPVPVDDRASGNEDTPIIGNVLPNDSDPDGDSLVVTGFSVEGDATSYLPSDTATIPGVGTISLAANGNFTFVPAPNYDGPVPSVVYTISDGHGGTGQATLVITIRPVDDFVPTPDGNIPDLPSGPDYFYDPDNVDGAVVEAVRGLDSLNDIAALSERPIDTTINVEHPPIRLGLAPFLGGSSTIVIDLPAGGDEKIQVEAIKHAGLVYLQITDEREGGGESTILSYRLRGAEGSTAAAWLSQPGPHTFVGHPAANTGTVDLILSVVQKDGRVFEYRLQLDSITGRLSQPPSPQDHGFEGGLAPMFSEQMNKASLSQNFALVERALGFR